MTALTTVNLAFPTKTRELSKRLPDDVSYHQNLSVRAKVQALSTLPADYFDHEAVRVLWFLSVAMDRKELAAPHGVSRKQAIYPRAKRNNSVRRHKLVVWRLRACPTRTAVRRLRAAGAPPQAPPELRPGLGQGSALDPLARYVAREGGSAPCDPRQGAALHPLGLLAPDPRQG